MVWLSLSSVIVGMPLATDGVVSSLDTAVWTLRSTLFVSISPMLKAAFSIIFLMARGCSFVVSVSKRSGNSSLETFGFQLSISLVCLERMVLGSPVVRSVERVRIFYKIHFWIWIFLTKQLSFASSCRKKSLMSLLLFAVEKLDFLSQKIIFVQFWS